MRAIFGKKIEMTRVFTESGKQIPVTLLEIKENTVARVRQVGDKKYALIAAGNKRRLNKPEKGIFEKSKIKPERVKEIANQGLEEGDKIDSSVFKEGEKINITAISKGKGFAGTVKRHHFNTGPRTHGSNNYRQPGSIGDTGPQRVVKGRRMGGHMGNKQVTLKEVEIYKILPEQSLIMIKGAVPGIRNSWNLLWSNNES